MRARAAGTTPSPAPRSRRGRCSSLIPATPASPRRLRSAPRPPPRWRPGGPRTSAPPATPRRPWLQAAAGRLVLRQRREPLLRLPGGRWRRRLELHAPRRGGRELARGGRWRRVLRFHRRHRLRPERLDRGADVLVQHRAGHPGLSGRGRCLRWVRAGGLRRHGPEQRVGGGIRHLRPRQHPWRLHQGLGVQLVGRHPGRHLVVSRVRHGRERRSAARVRQQRPRRLRVRAQRQDRRAGLALSDEHRGRFGRRRPSRPSPRAGGTASPTGSST